MSQGNADHTFCAAAGAVEKQHETQLWLIKPLVIQPANRINKKKTVGDNGWYIKSLSRLIQQSHPHLSANNSIVILVP